MSKKSALGRGLDALIPDMYVTVEQVTENRENLPQPEGTIVEIPIGSIDPNVNQPRKRFDEDALQTLSDSIAQNGLFSPILVVRDDHNRYTIVAGERRWRAARMAGLSKIPAIVRDLDEQRRQEVSLIENIQREDLNPIEEAKGIYRLISEHSLTQEQISAKIGRSRPAVANLLRLLNLPQVIQDSLINGELTAGHARVLAGIDDPDFQNTLFVATLSNEWTVRQLENAAKKGPPSSEEEKPEKPSFPPEVNDLCDRIRNITGMQVQIKGSPDSGKLILPYSSRDELQKLWDLVYSIPGGVN